MSAKSANAANQLKRGVPVPLALLLHHNTATASPLTYELAQC
jgi:hypothetical protein